MQVDPIKPMVPPGTKHLKLHCDILLPTVAFKFNLRHYTGGWAAVDENCPLGNEAFPAEYDPRGNTTYHSRLIVPPPPSPPAPPAPPPAPPLPSPPPMPPLSPPPPTPPLSPPPTPPPPSPPPTPPPSLDPPRQAHVLLLFNFASTLLKR